MQDELLKAKDALANSLPGAFETSVNTVNSFSTSSSTTSVSTTTRIAQEVNAVTSEQVLAVARRYIVPDRLVVIAVGDRNAIEAELRKLNLGTVEIRDLEGRPASSSSL